MSIVERPSGYGVRVREHGKRIWLGMFATRELAVQAEHDWKMARAGSPTVDQWVRVWHRDYARAAAATRVTYRSGTERVVKDLGHLRLDDVDRPRARQLAREWPRATTRVARTLWADAVRDGLAKLNPWTNLRLETPRGRKDLTALTEPQILELAQVARATLGTYGEEFAAILATLGYVGCRPGELCALRRTDLDAKLGELTIRFSLDATGVEKAPKNGKARVVLVPPPALEAIASVPVRGEYLFHTAHGKRLSKGALSYAWRLVRVAWMEQGNPTLDLYSLRHASATMMVTRGMPAWAVAQMLGHTDGGRLVMELYGHPENVLARDLARMAFAGAPVAAYERRSA